MNYEIFKETILTRLEEDIPGPKQIRIQQIHRNNGELLDGLVILENSANISPAIYLNRYYVDLKQGRSFREIYQRILDCYRKNRTDQRIDVRFFTDFERIRPRIAAKLIHREKNMGSLSENVPHIPFLDLAIVFYCLFPVDSDIGNATILLDRSHLALWKITAEELYPIAMENSQRLMPPQLRSINQVLREMTGPAGYPSSPLPEDPLFPMYVLSNEENLFGAVCIAYDGLIRSCADRFGSDLYILPSSVHEVILVPLTGEERMESYSDMVREVNRSQVAPEDVLSDHAYYYSREKDEILY